MRNTLPGVADRNGPLPAPAPTGVFDDDHVAETFRAAIFAVLQADGA
jgi:hypothetical protein